jgi:hypothetical protein
LLSARAFALDEQLRAGMLPSDVLAALAQIKSEAEPFEVAFADVLAAAGM